MPVVLSISLMRVSSLIIHFGRVSGDREVLTNSGTRVPECLDQAWNTGVLRYTGISPGYGMLKNSLH